MSGMKQRKKRRPVERRSIDERLTPLIVQTLEEGISGLRGRPVRVRELRREFALSSSSFPTERLRVTLDGERRPLNIFFKDLHPEHQMKKARALRELDRTPSRRELDMYLSILSHDRLGTLHLYASRWEPDRGRFWLFLEDAGRTVLNNVYDLSEWTAAAGWAARFHAATRDLPAARTSFLPEWDGAHYRRCAEGVEALLSTVSDAGEREVLRRGLDWFTERLDWFSDLPRCVIHGQFFGKNIMLRPRSAAHRIAVIDWETAALGPRAFDLASLSSGKWTAEQRQAMWAAYLDRCRAETGEPLEWESLREELVGAGIYQALEWLVWWGDHRSLSRHFLKFLRELDALLDGRLAPEPIEASEARG